MTKIRGVIRAGQSRERQQPRSWRGPWPDRVEGLIVFIYSEIGLFFLPHDGAPDQRAGETNAQGPRNWGRNAANSWIDV